MAKAIALYGSTNRSSALVAELVEVEHRLEAFRQQLQEKTVDLPDLPIERIREFVLRQATNLKSVLLQDRAAAKRALRIHFKPLVLAPKTTPDGPVFTVEGTFDLFQGWTM
jgi:cytochrome c-type biogenesis protein CcmH/NrfG